LGVLDGDCGGLATFDNLKLDTAGSYMIKAQVGGLVVSPGSSSFTITAALPGTISATVPQPLHPGGSAQAIPVSFDSPKFGNGGGGVNGTQVTNLTVTMQSITGGGRGPNPCTAADLQITQIPAGVYPFYIRGGTSTLASIIGAGNMPTIQMVDRQDTGPGDHSGNEDACKNATINLAFTETS
jgi:hypothetical protein